MNEDTLENIMKAAEQGDANASYKLGQHYLNGEDRDYKKALSWFVTAANQGHAHAPYYCGDANDYISAHFNQYGDPLKPFFQTDLEKANKWYAIGAERGDYYAQKRLAEKYAKGMGIPKDLEKTNYWYTKAAEQGDQSAQYELGVNYANGSGIPKDLEKAKYWIAQAAEQGYEDAQKALIQLDAGHLPKKNIYGFCDVIGAIIGAIFVAVIGAIIFGFLGFLIGAVVGWFGGWKVGEHFS